MNCSHGLAYEVKCSMCYSEAMARVMSAVKTAGVKPTVPSGSTLLYDKGERVGVQVTLDSIRSSRQQ